MDNIMQLQSDRYRILAFVHSNTLPRERTLKYSNSMHDILCRNQ